MHSVFFFLMSQVCFDIKPGQEVIALGHGRLKPVIKRSETLVFLFPLPVSSGSLVTEECVPNTWEGLQLQQLQQRGYVEGK